MRWTTGKYDGTTGVGQQMSALEVVQANLFDTVAGLLTNNTGGTSKGNSAAGRGPSDGTAVPDDSSIVTMADRVVAWVATGALGVLLGGYLYLAVT
jgi:mannan endo-1,6-alpha-mannosidase